jgi:hypothetical protein
MMDRLEEGVEKAGRIVAAEKRIAKAIRSGVEIATLLRVDETLERKAKEVFVPQLQMEKK